MLKYLAVRRDARFSPNSEAKDRDILQSVCNELQRREALDEAIPMVDETDFARRPIEATCYVSMARLPEALQQLSAMEARGCRVFNRAEGVERCQRSLLEALMKRHNIPAPAAFGRHGYWLKRGDAAAQSKDDVVFCHDKASLLAAQEAFRERGITEMVVSAHVVGDLIKFYGVGKRMFSFFYPSDDGISKFGDEERNGKSHHYPFDEVGLRNTVTKLAAEVGIEVYGGDAIVDESGKFYIIDFNDWPSFSRCKDAAAAAIAMEILENNINYK